MSSRKQILAIGVVALLTLCFIAWNGIRAEFIHGDCIEVHRSLLRCIGIVFFEQYQALAYISISILASVSPLYWSKEVTYTYWKNYARIVLPIMVILILITPTNAPGDYISLGFDREIASMTFSILFLLVSWVLIGYKALSNCSK